MAAKLASISNIAARFEPDVLYGRL